MPHEPLDFIVVSDEQKSNRVPVPGEEDAYGDIRAELPETAAQFFDAVTCGDLLYVHGEHEGVHRPLNGHLFMREKSLEASLKTVGKRETEHAGKMILQGPQMAAGFLQALKLLSPLAAFCVQGHRGDFLVRKAGDIEVVDGVPDKLGIAFAGLDRLSAQSLYFLFIEQDLNPGHDITP